jgi:hypothetical protein
MSFGRSRLVTMSLLAFLALGSAACSSATSPGGLPPASRTHGYAA